MNALLRPSVVLFCVAFALSHVATSARAQSSEDPVAPLLPTDMKQCEALQEAWNERITALYQNDKECIAQFDRTCHAGDACMRQLTLGWAECGSESAYYGWTGCQGVAQSLACARDASKQAVFTCRAKVNAYRSLHAGDESSGVTNITSENASQSIRTTLTPAAKSIFNRVLETVFGSYATTASTAYLLAKNLNGKIADARYWSDYLERKNRGTTTAREDYDASIRMLRSLPEFTNSPLRRTILDLETQFAKEQGVEIQKTLDDISEQIEKIAPESDGRSVATRGRGSNSVQSLRACVNTCLDRFPDDSSARSNCETACGTHQ